MKFKRYVATLNKNVQEFSSVNVIEEDSTLVLHFNKPPITGLPYQIENCLEDASITYYQKVVLIPFLYKIHSGNKSEYSYAYLEN